MAETRDFQCPNCGSPLMTDGTQNEIKCAYCGSSVIVPQELRTPVVRPVQVYPVFSQDYGNADQVAKQMGQVGKVVAGVTISAVLAPIIITGIVFLVIAVVIAVVFLNINKSVDSVTQNVIPTAIYALAEDTATPAPSLTPVPPTPIPTPTLAPTPIPESTPFSKVLLQDKFTNSKSGWDQVNETDYLIQYVKGGGYRIFVNAQDGGEAVWLSKNFKDVNVEVDAKYAAGPDDGLLGVTCRVKDKVGFYSFEFNPQGYYSIEKYVTTSDGSKPETLAEGTLAPNTIQPESTNHLRGDCVGQTLTLYLNDQPLLQVTDSTFSSGGVGLIVQTGDSGEAGVDVLFNNFLVKGR